MTAADPVPRGGIIALDISLTTGFAYGVAGSNAPISGIWPLAPHGAGTLGEACVALEDHLSDAIERHAPGLVFIEAPLLEKTQTSARLLISLAGSAESTCARYRVTCREQHAQTIRLNVMGRGRFPTGQAKSHVLAWCRAQGWAPADHNEADALVCWAFASKSVLLARSGMAA